MVFNRISSLDVKAAIAVTLARIRYPTTNGQNNGYAILIMNDNAILIMRFFGEIDVSFYISQNRIDENSLISLKSWKGKSEKLFPQVHLYS